MKTRKQKEKVIVLEDIEKIDIKYVLNKVSGNKKAGMFLGETVNVYHMSLKTFLHKGTTCVCCGLKAEYFTLDKTDNQVKYHLGLYAMLEGKEIQFTKDHIIPKSAGGSDKLCNMQTMCEECNNIKADLGTASSRKVLHRELPNQAKGTKAYQRIVNTNKLCLLNLAQLYESSRVSPTRIRTLFEIDKETTIIKQLVKREEPNAYLTAKGLNTKVNEHDAIRQGKLRELRVLQGVV